jgi:quercetin dioxygenase-like cupin family protein
MPGKFYNLHDLSQGHLRHLAEGMEARIFAGEKAMLSVLRVAPNAVGEVHHHPEEQWGVLLEGSGVRIQGGEEYPVSAGDFWWTPKNVLHGFRAGGEGAFLIDIFSPPRGDYELAGRGFAAKLGEAD